MNGIDNDNLQSEGNNSIHNNISDDEPEQDGQVNKDVDENDDGEASSASASSSSTSVGAMAVTNASAMRSDPMPNNNHHSTTASATPLMYNPISNYSLLRSLRRVFLCLSFLSWCCLF